MVYHPVKKIADLVEPLTRREKEILELLTTDRSNAEIAEDLSLALSSVKWYAQQIYSKLGVENRRQAVRKARELGILEGPERTAGHGAGLSSGTVNIFNVLPLAARGTPHHNLPVQLTSFIGRENEIARLQGLILARQAAGLVTLTGSGGTGKTRLALRAAERLLEWFPQGIWLVELAPVSDPALVLRTVADALGIREDPQSSLLQFLKAYLRDRQMLLILDNCEHLVGEAAAIVSALLHACPRLRILATSWEILGVEGEIPFRCPSLVGADAVRLFVERAQTITPGFAQTDTNAPVIARICERLDGIPLAIELAAAHTRMLSLEQIAARLDQAFRLLTGGSRSVLPRHQTLKALIDWSFNLLSPEERALLMRLSVFAGGWMLDAAVAVCADYEEVTGRANSLLRPEQTLNLLGQLLDKSLIQVEEDQAGEPRYRMLETVRQYARDRYVGELQAENSGVENLY